MIFKSPFSNNFNSSTLFYFSSLAIFRFLKSFYCHFPLNMNLFLFSLILNNFSILINLLQIYFFQQASFAKFLWFLIFFYFHVFNKHRYNFIIMKLTHTKINWELVGPYTWVFFFDYRLICLMNITWFLSYSVICLWLFYTCYCSLTLFPL